MSSPLALAAVSAVLSDLLNDGLIDHDVTSVVGTHVAVSALPPDRVVAEGGSEVDQLNLFLYQVTPNTGWSNTALPSRDARGDRLTNPPLALDLHYLLTAYGAAGFHAEILLGYALQILHETPVLGREAIRRALSSPSPVDGSILPPALQALSAADLADQVELLKITPETLDSETISRLWSALQTHYRTTAAYRVSVVLIEGTRPARAPLPVLSRGAVDAVSGRDRGVVVQADLRPPYPGLDSLTLPVGQGALRMGDTLTVHGHHLRREPVQEVRIRFTHVGSSTVLDLPTATADATECTVTLPTVPPGGSPTPETPEHPDSWRCGVYGVAALVRQAGEPDRLTQQLPVALAPRIDTFSTGTTGGITTVTVGCAPKVWRGQRVELLVGQRQLTAEPLTVDRTDTLLFRTTADRLPTGPQWVRLRVDGVESLLVDRREPVPRFNPSERRTL